MLSSEQKILCTISHLGILCGVPILAPLIILLLADDEYVKLQSKEALVFQGVMVLVGIIGGILTLILIGFAVLAIVGPLSIIAPIVAVVKLWNDKDFSYPITGSWARKH